jgi:hypothetical protein
MRDYTKLVVYVRQELGAGTEYNDYRPRLDTIRQIADVLPEARVTVVTSTDNPECRREVARFARIVEHLSGWTTSLVEDSPATRQRLAVAQVPTFIIKSAETGRELGRIVRGPTSGSLEADLRTISEEHPSRIVV